jgi:hypothetical protein
MAIMQSVEGSSLQHSENFLLLLILALDVILQSASAVPYETRYKMID